MAARYSAVARAATRGTGEGGTVTRLNFSVLEFFASALDNPADEEWPSCISRHQSPAAVWDSPDRGSKADLKLKL